jgi:hypothetical protein
MRPQARRVSIPLVLALGAFCSATAASAACPQPRMLRLSEANGPNCDARTCGFIIAHWAGAPGCDHYNIRERLGKQFEAPGTNRNQLHNQRSAQFPGRFSPNGAEIHVKVQGCTRNFFGVSSCGAWSPEVTMRVNDPADSPKEKACQKYAERAVGAVKYAKDMGCDAKVISGPRWTSDFQEHRLFCMRSPAAQSNAEDRARNRIAQECRIQAGKPKVGKLTLSVTSRAGDTFFVKASGFGPNVPVVIRLSGPGASTSAVTVVKGERIVANAKGEVSVTLFGAQICKRGGGAVTFTAEDQDNHKTPSATAKCAP